MTKVAHNIYVNPAFVIKVSAYAAPGVFSIGILLSTGELMHLQYESEEARDAVIRKLTR